MMLQFARCVIIFTILSSSIHADDPCSFKDSTGRVIDLSSLANTDGKAKFADLIPTQSSTDWSMYLLITLWLLYDDYFDIEYSFNPCKSFTEGTLCVDVAVCQGDWLIFNIVV